VLVQLAPRVPLNPDAFSTSSVAKTPHLNRGTPRGVFAEITDLAPRGDAKEVFFRLRQAANGLMDLDKQWPM